MTFIITAHVPEGIAMASDSRLTINRKREENGHTVVDFAAAQSDTAIKTFLAANRTGLSMFGDGTIGIVPIAGYIEQFLGEEVTVETPIESVPRLLVEHFQKRTPVPDTGFHVAGYGTEAGSPVQRVWRVFLKTGEVQEVAPSTQARGVLWNGEQDILTRVLNRHIQIASDEGTVTPLPAYDVPFDMFTLQDAIDFMIYAIRITADTMRFQVRPKTVGGPIDVLVLRPKEASWLARKSLRAAGTGGE